MQQPLKKQKKSPEETRDAIIDAAFELFAARGFHATTVEEIMTKSGVSKGGLAWHFKSKNDILEALARMRMETEWNDTVGIFLQDKDILEQISQYIEAVVNPNPQEPQWLRLMNQFLLSLPGGLESLAEQVYTHYQRVADVIASAFEKGRERGELSQDVNPRMQARALISFARSRSIDPLDLNSNTSTEEVRTYMVHRFIDSLRRED